MQFTAVGDVTLHYKVEGPDDGLPLVFVNSLGTDLRIWDGLTPHLTDKYRDRNLLRVRYDKRGHGLSDSPPGPYSLADERADLAALLQYLGVSTPIVVGISVGGMIAVDYAAHHRVRALVVCDSALRFATAAFWNARSATIRREGMAAVAPTLAPRWFAPDFAEREPATYQGYVNMLARTPAQGYIATCDLLAEEDVIEQAGAVEAPALVVGGAQDSSSPPEMVRALAKALPAAQFELIEGAGHLPCVEQPVALAQTMAAFLEEHLEDVL